MTVAYIIAVLVVCYFIGRNKKFSADTVQEKPKFVDTLLVVISKIAVGFAVVYFGFAVFFFEMLIEDYWLSFNPERTAEIENRFGIVVDDDIKLKKYKVVSHREGAMRTLEFESDIDGAEFMRKNCQGELIQYVEDDVCYSPKYLNVEPYAYTLGDNQAGIYKYIYNDYMHEMIFYYNGDGYRVKIN